MLRKVCILSMLSLALAGCAGTNGAYYPSTEFTDLGPGSWGAGTPQSFSRYLRLWNEPIIFNNTTLDFAVRLACRPSFDNDCVIRLEQRGDRATIVGKMFNHNDPSKVLSRQSFALGKQEVEQIRNIVTRSNFWSADNDQKIVGNDGEDWIVEVKDGAKYHAAYVWGPSEGAVYEIGDALMKLYNAHIH